MAQGKTAYDFLNSDFSKGFGSMGFDMQSLMELQRKNMQAFTEAQQLTMVGMQAVAQKQTEFFSQLMEDNSKLAKEMMGSATTEEKVACQANMVKKSYEKSMMNAQKIAEMVGNSNQQASEIIGKRISTSLDEMKASMDKAKKKATKAA